MHRIRRARAGALPGVLLVVMTSLESFLDPNLVRPPWLGLEM